ncbi:hypothetical protein HMI55_004978 [Coelomomyces lativittatus]|nr:hypothetical protein HMI55_004978 [Coelomomyces lativittatus]
MVRCFQHQHDGASKHEATDFLHHGIHGPAVGLDRDRDRRGRGRGRGRGRRGGVRGGPRRRERGHAMNEDGPYLGGPDQHHGHGAMVP